MKGIGFILAVVLGLLIFGVPILGCFMGLLVIILGVGVDVAMTLGMILTVVMFVGMRSRCFSWISDFAEHLESRNWKPVWRVKWTTKRLKTRRIAYHKSERRN